MQVFNTYTHEVICSLWGVRKSDSSAAVCESSTVRSAFYIGSSKGASVMLMLYLIRMEKVSCTGGAVMFCVSAIFL